MRTEMNLAHTPLGEVGEMAKENQRRVSTQGLNSSICINRGRNKIIHGQEGGEMWKICSSPMNHDKNKSRESILPLVVMEASVKAMVTISQCLYVCTACMASHFSSP